MFFRLNADRCEKIEACAKKHKNSNEVALVMMLRAFGRTHGVAVPFGPLPDKGPLRDTRTVRLLIPKVDGWTHQLINQSKSATLAAMVERAIDQYEPPEKKKAG